MDGEKRILRAKARSLDMGLEAHRAGQLNQAEDIYRQLLSDNPNHVDALHLLGMLKNQEQKHDEAEQLIRRAISIQPRQPIFYSNLGLVLMTAGKVFPAIDAYQIAELLDPKSAENLNNLAVALHSIGQTSEAIACVKRAFLLRSDYVDARDNLLRLLQLQPDSARGYHVLGDLLFEAHRQGDAAMWYRKSLELNPQSAETQNNLGNTFSAGGMHDQAIACYQRALAINQEFGLAWNNLANSFRELGQLSESIGAYQRAIELQPQSASLLSNLGTVLVAMKQFEAAMACYQKALLIDAAHGSTHNNIGNLFCETGEWTLAVESYRKTLSINPDYADAINNLGTALEELGDRDAAMECYRRANSLDGLLVSPPWNIALLQLLGGEYEPGWLGYEYRWRQKKQSKTWRQFDQPVLINLLIPEGTRILLHAEQGFGDAIQFCRYAPLLAKLGMTVWLECPRPLVELFESLPGVDRVIASGNAIPDFDVHCPLMSLPKVFGTLLENIPKTPYLRAPDSRLQKWKLRFETQPVSFRVGLVWAGQSTHQKDLHRSLSLSDFSDLGQIPGITFYSLQVGDAAWQAKSPPSGMHLVDWAGELIDFAETAALITQLDLVIAVDTAVCHVAGAIGKPVWILIAFQPDWRWLLDRKDSPWYPTAKLFRQTRPGDWSQPLAQIDRRFTRCSQSRRLRHAK